MSSILCTHQVIILVPRLNNTGGVANYYSAIQPFLSKSIHYLFRGKDGKKNIILRSLLDYYHYIKTVYNNKNYGVVVINHSLGPGSFFRDAFYTLLTPKKYKQIIYFRGWNPAYEKKIDKSWFHQKWLKHTFLKADHIIVLSSAFKAKLFEWGYNRPITIETTVVDEQLLNGKTFNTISDFRSSMKEPHLLYLGNVSEAKGVWEVLKAKEYLDEGLSHNTQIIIAGVGKELTALQQYSKEKKINVEFPGFVRQERKAQTFLKAHLYIFPSIHGEGMPNSILEAMAFGLPIITTRVGGIPDFFVAGKMGLYIDAREPKHIAEKIQWLLDRPELMKQMSEYNYNYAREHFYASMVARRLENMIASVENKTDKK